MKYESEKQEMNNKHKKNQKQKIKNKNAKNEKTRKSNIKNQKQKTTKKLENKNSKKKKLNNKKKKDTHRKPVIHWGPSGGVVERGALSVKQVGARSADFSYSYVGAPNADAKRSERGALIQKRVGAWSADAKKRSELGAEENRGARSGEVKKGRSAERQCQKGPERGAIFTPGRAPTYLTRFSPKSG